MKTASLALVAATFLAGPPIRAQEQPAAPASPPAEKPADKPAEKPATKKTPTVSAGPEGFVIQSEEGDYKLQLRGLVQFDGRFFPGDEDQTAINNFLVRRARPIFQGAAGKYFEFNFTPDFGVGAVVIQDAYLDVKASTKLRVRLGKFKPPIGLEHLQADPVIPFAERSYPSGLLPSRDVGFQLSGDLAGGVLSYAGGLFDGAPDSGSADVDTNDSKDAVGRIVLSPFKKTKSFLKELGFGLAGSTGRQTGALPAYRSGGQVSMITLVTGVVADGTRTRVAPDLSLYSGPFGFGAEYAQSESWVRKTATSNRVRLEAKAWQATASFAVTGEQESYNGIKVKKPFDPAKGQWGAVELVGRVNGLELAGDAISAGLVDPAKSVRKAFAWALGVNWWLTRNFKQAVDYERTTFTGGGGATGDRRPENAIFLRSQVYF